MSKRLATKGTIGPPGKPGGLRGLLIKLSCTTMLMAAPGATMAQQVIAAPDCVELECPAYADPGGAYHKAVGESTETETGADNPTASGEGELGFSISVDGERIAGDATPVDTERKTDIGLEEVDIQVKFDGLDQRPILNVSTVDTKRTYRAGDQIEFLATSNYPGWIARREVLVYPRRERRFGSVSPIVVPVDQAGSAVWIMPEEGASEFNYVLRVYDNKGRFDETEPLSLARTDKNFEADASKEQLPPVSPGNGDDRTRIRNIPVYGGAVTVYGRNVPPGYAVTALGESVPVDRDSEFVVQRILPPGEHVVDVALTGAGKDDGLTFRREINIPSNDWFYVGLADFTLGRRFGDDAIEAVKPGEYDKTYSKGRLAFYLKGKIKGKYLLTASADTREDKVENLFRGLDGKDPRNFLTRIDPDDYYPVYGDDSTAIEDAPTRGKFYVRLERGESRVMWGNFKADVSGSKFVRNERALYGASAVYKSESKTSFGESHVKAEVYGANAETLPQRDVLRATGGSAYFLKYQDITIGSETITIEIRDRLSGRVVSTRRLSAGVDYEIDHLQGVIILKRPLSSSTMAGGATRPDAIGEDNVYLVAQYEYTPTAGNISGLSYGGRAEGWLGDHVRVGVTGMKEEVGGDDQNMVSADIVLRHSDTTYLEAEIAQTEGPGFGKSYSNDGGNTIIDNGTAGRAGKKARGYSLKGQVDLADVSQGAVKGTVGGFYERMEEGFSTLDYDIDSTQRVWGGFASVQLGDKWTLSGDYEDFADADGEKKREATADIEYQLNEYWKVAFGARHVGIWNVARDSGSWNGSRTDLGARVTYSPTDDTSAYVFGQTTVARSGNLNRNDRIGIGGETRLTDTIGVGGEVSYGTSGWGALAAVTYDPTVDRNYYIGYRLSPEEEISVNRLGSSDDNKSGFVAGLRHRYNDQWTVFSEANTDMFGRERSLATTYGVEYTPDTMWTVTAGLEAGNVQDDQTADFERYAPSVGIIYKDEDRLSASLKAEARFENSADDSRDQTSYYFAGGLGVKTSEDWRVLGNVDAVLSNPNQSSIRDGDYIEASLGAAYRPIDNDRFNGLFKYVFLYDLPGPDQVGAVTGTTYAPLQRSHILSADGTYDVNQYLSIGAKYGFRIGQTAPRDDRDNWTDSQAHLGIIRADFHVVRNWDILGEGRVLYSPTAGTTDWGALAAVYRHFGDNVKVGVGYNFGIFSDDLRDLTLDDQGVFMNVIGKF